MVIPNTICRIFVPDNLKKDKAMKLFITAFIQVFAVCMNTYFIAQLFWIGIVVVGFVISMTWTFNVKKISISGMENRLLYSFGACIGGVLGVYIGTLIT